MHLRIPQLMKEIERIQSLRGLALVSYLVALLLGWSGLAIYAEGVSADQARSALSGEPGFTFDCDNTPMNPCRILVASYRDKPVKIESSSVAWSERYQRAIVVSDNYNDLVAQNAAHFVIATFSLENDSPQIPVEPLLTPEQAEQFPLYDLEGVTLVGDHLYAIGSLALHGKDPERDRWERHQFVQMDLEEKNGVLTVSTIAHVSKRWPNFRVWIISKSGYAWTAEETRGRAEGQGINVEALSATSRGTLIIGFRGPSTSDGGSLALEIAPPSFPRKEPRLVKAHRVPPVPADVVAEGAPKTLRGMIEIPASPGEYYVLLGPKGYEKELIVLSRWNAKTGELTKATALPKGFVAEGCTPISDNTLLIVDDLKERILVATEN